MVDFLIVAYRVKGNHFFSALNFTIYEKLGFFIFKLLTNMNLGFVESGGVLPLEVGAVLPEAGRGEGGDGGDGDGVVHHSVLVRQNIPQLLSLLTHLLRPL